MRNHFDRINMHIKLRISQSLPSSLLVVEKLPEVKLLFLTTIGNL